MNSGYFYKRLVKCYHSVSHKESKAKKLKWFVCPPPPAPNFRSAPTTFYFIFIFTFLCSFHLKVVQNQAKFCDRLISDYKKRSELAHRPAAVV